LIGIHCKTNFYLFHPTAEAVGILEKGEVNIYAPDQVCLPYGFSTPLTDSASIGLNKPGNTAGVIQYCMCSGRVPLGFNPPGDKASKRWFKKQPMK
jgi:hypothetical protein